jgi:hypothetical protein
MGSDGDADGTGSSMGSGFAGHVGTSWKKKRRFFASISLNVNKLLAS